MIQIGGVMNEIDGRAGAVIFARAVNRAGSVKLRRYSAKASLLRMPGGIRSNRERSQTSALLPISVSGIGVFWIRNHQWKLAVASSFVTLCNTL